MVDVWPGGSLREELIRMRKHGRIGAGQVPPPPPEDGTEARPATTAAKRSEEGAAAAGESDKAAEEEAGERRPTVAIALTHCSDSCKDS